MVTPMVMPVIDMGALLDYKSGMASLILSLLAATLAAVPVWAIFGPAQALGTAAGLALVLWPLMALSMRIMGVIIALLGEAITNHRAHG
jgi:hypothetical protein